jgi:hypothetical protein
MTEENIMAYADVALPSLILPNIIYPVLEKVLQVKILSFFCNILIVYFSDGKE